MTISTAMGVAKLVLLLTISLVMFDAQAQVHSGAEVTKACWDKGGSHVAIVDCEVKERDQLRTEMLQHYEQIRKEAQHSDKEMKALGSEALIYKEESLVNSQKAFEKYLEAECQRKMNEAMGGTAGADYHVACEIDLIAQRIERLGKQK